MKNKSNLDQKIKTLSFIRNILCITAVILAVILVFVAAQKKPFSALQEPGEEASQKNTAQKTETTIPQITQAPAETPAVPSDSDAEPVPSIKPDEVLPEESEAISAITDPTAETSGEEPVLPKDEDSASSEETTASDAETLVPGADWQIAEGETLEVDGVNPLLPTGQVLPPAAEDVTEATTETQPALPCDPEQEQTKNHLWLAIFIGLTGLLIADMIALLCISIKINRLIRKKNENAARLDSSAMKRVNAEQSQTAVLCSGISIGKIHHIGARERQEDSYGVTGLQDGVLAVVADGMGGLSNGNQISRKIVSTILKCAEKLPEKLPDGILMKMVQAAADAVHAMMGQENFCKSGSTLLTVLIHRSQMHWAAVGDSHIYFYRNGELIQLNQEHNRGQSLLIQAANGEISMSEAKNATKKGGLTSFIGMGTLKNVERSICPIPVQPGDRVILCSDGVFNILTDEALIAILKQFPDVQAAADRIQSLILRRNHPQQDNFTAVILGI